MRKWRQHRSPTVGKQTYNQKEHCLVTILSLGLSAIACSSFCCEQDIPSPVQKFTLRCWLWVLFSWNGYEKRALFSGVSHLE
jgi:hypothetical protein